MKSILKVYPTSAPIDSALLLLRVAISILMLTHGVPKMNALFSGDPVQFVSLFGLSPELTLGLVVFAEVFCSVLVLTGFAIRLAVIPLIITMMVAVFSFHAADPFSKQEMGLHYLLSYLVLLFSGSGKYSFDYLVQSSIKQQVPLQLKKSNVPV